MQTAFPQTNVRIVRNATDRLWTFRFRSRALAATVAFAQATRSSAQSGSQMPAQAGSQTRVESVAPAGSVMGGGSTSGQNGTAAQQANPLGGQPGTGSGMGKTSGTPAGN